MSYDPHIHHRRSIRFKGYDYSQEGLYYITICVQDRLCLFGNVGAPLVGAPINNGAPINDNDTPKNINAQNDNGRQIGQPRGIAPTHARTHAQKNDDAQNNNGYLNDNGRQIGQPQGIAPTHAPTHAQINDNAQNDNGSLDDNGRQIGQPQGIAPTHAPTHAQINDNAQNDNGSLDDNGRQIGQPRGIAPTHARTHATTDGTTDAITPTPIMILNDSGKMVEVEWLKLAERFRNIELHEYVVMPNHFHGILQIVDTSSVGKTVGDMMGAFKSITTVEYIHGVKQSGWKPFDGRLWQRNYWEHIIRDDQSYQRISDYIIDNPAKWKADKFFNQ